MTKDELRKHIRMMKRMYGTSQLSEQSVTVIDRLRSNPVLAKAHTILMYYSLDDEVCTHTFVDDLVQQGKEVLLPVVIDDCHMELHRYTGKNDLRGGFFNIMEPIGELFHDYERIDVAVVPGMAFDSRGNRLGRGKGYYDRLLPLLQRAYKIGICFPFQRVPGIPADEHDIKMDEVI